MPDAPHVPVVVDAGVDGTAVDVALDAPLAPLYTVTEALEDVLASPLKFIGRGEWFGNASIHACAYRNARVIAVNVYCTAKETPALSLVVLSPTRGRVVIYAEADGAISTLSRADYFTFRVEVEPPLEADPFKPTFTYAELRAWDERRYEASEGACWYADAEGCSGGLEPQLAAWSPSAKSLIAEPPATWYRLTKDLHAMAVRDHRK